MPPVRGDPAGGGAAGSRHGPRRRDCSAGRSCWRAGRRWPARSASPWLVPMGRHSRRCSMDFVVPQATDLYHVQTILFTLLLGATVGVMSRSGGTKRAGRGRRRRGEDPHPGAGHGLGARVPRLLRRLLEHPAAGRHDPAADGPAEGEPRKTGVPDRLHRRPDRRTGADFHVGRGGNELYLRRLREDRGRPGRVRRVPGDGAVPVLPDLPAGVRGGGSRSPGGTSARCGRPRCGPRPAAAC